jgi:TRAP-type C4-dicarboxylate transport system permease small subunit
MRRFLNFLYSSSAAVAALFLVGVLVMVLLSVFGRLMNFHVPGTDAYAGYFMAGSGFLALAHTLKRGEHIRVTLLLNALQGPANKAMQLWSLAAASALAGVFAFFCVRLAYQSYELNDISTGSDATPLWIPQIAMALGVTMLAVAFVDDLVLEIAGKRTTATTGESLRNE